MLPGRAAGRREVGLTVGAAGRRAAQWARAPRNGEARAGGGGYGLDAVEMNGPEFGVSLEPPCGSG